MGCDNKNVVLLLHYSLWIIKTSRMCAPMISAFSVKSIETLNWVEINVGHIVRPSDSSEAVCRIVSDDGLDRIFSKN